MAEQMENVNANLEGDEPEDDYEGDLGDAAQGKGTSSGIIGINPT